MRLFNSVICDHSSRATDRAVCGTRRNKTSKRSLTAPFPRVSSVESNFKYEKVAKFSLGLEAGFILTSSDSLGQWRMIPLANGACRTKLGRVRTNWLGRRLVSRFKVLIVHASSGELIRTIQLFCPRLCTRALILSSGILPHCCFGWSRLALLLRRTRRLLLRTRDLRCTSWPRPWRMVASASMV